MNVDHATINRWVNKYSAQLEENFRKCQRRIGSSWYLDETYIKVKGKWKYLYRAVDSSGHTVDFLLTAKRHKNAARRFLAKAISGFGQPKKINIDKSGANFAALVGHNDDTKSKIGIRQIKYLNNIVEQDHRAIKRIIRPMMGFKSFWYAADTIAGIELVHMLRKGQMKEDATPSLHQKFELLAT